MSNLRLIPRSPSIQFENSTLYFTNIEGVWWIAIKPICEVLGLDPEAQRKSLKRDPILGQLPSDQTVVAADGKARKMVCLPEQWIYGWLFQLNSRNEKFLAFKKHCYQVLYAYFKGEHDSRKATIREIALAKRELQQLKRELSTNEQYNRAQELHCFISGKGKELKRGDRRMEQEQMELFLDE
jgi:hypothetical protein